MEAPSAVARIRIAGVLLALALTGAGTAQAATFTVLNTNDSGPGSLRQAILDATGSPGLDTIAFAPAAAGTIVLATTLPAVAEDLDIVGPGSAVLTVSGNHAAGLFFFVFGVNATLSGLTLADGLGRAVDGGGGTLTISDCILSGNQGGGIHWSGTLTVSNCTLSGNQVGGGIDASGTVTISHSILAGNDDLGEGGAVGASFGASTLTITDSTLSNNHAGFSGGAIQNAGNLVIARSTLSGNRADLIGGAILNQAGFGSTPEGRLTITESTFTGNTAGTGGGGAIANGGTATIDRSTFAGNTTTGGGGGIFSVATLAMRNSTLSANSAAGSGGGLMNSQLFPGAGSTISFTTLVGNIAAAGGGLSINSATASVTIKNSIVASNVGGDCANPGAGSFSSLGANDATDSSCPGFTQVAPAQLGLGPLAANGGLTQTHALLPGSVAIDASQDCTDAGGSVVFEDQRGSFRPVDGDRTGGPACDAGAYEVAANGLPLEIPALDRRGLVLLILLLAAAAILVLRLRAV